MCVGFGVGPSNSVKIISWLQVYMETTFCGHIYITSNCPRVQPVIILQLSLEKQTLLLECMSIFWIYPSSAHMYIHSITFTARICIVIVNFIHSGASFHNANRHVLFKRLLRHFFLRFVLYS